jgi:hypothetical protein
VCLFLFAGLALVTLELELDFVLSSLNENVFLHVLKKEKTIMRRYSSDMILLDMTHRNINKFCTNQQ